MVNLLLPLLLIFNFYPFSTLINSAKVDSWCDSFDKSWQAIRSFRIQRLWNISLVDIVFGLLWAVLFYSEGFSIIKEAARQNLPLFGFFVLVSDLTGFISCILSFL